MNPKLTTVIGSLLSLAAATSAFADASAPACTGKVAKEFQGGYTVDSHAILSNESLQMPVRITETGMIVPKTVPDPMRVESSNTVPLATCVREGSTVLTSIYGEGANAMFINEVIKKDGNDIVVMANLECMKGGGDTVNCESIAEKLKAPNARTYRFTFVRK